MRIGQIHGRFARIDARALITRSGSLAFLDLGSERRSTPVDSSTLRDSWPIHQPAPRVCVPEGTSMDHRFPSPSTPWSMEIERLAGVAFCLSVVNFLAQ